MSDTGNNFDATEFAGGSFIKKDDLMAGPQRFTIEGVCKVTFEARNGRPAQDVLQLDFDEERKFSLNKTNTKLLIKAFGRNTSEWVGKEIVLHHDPNVMFTFIVLAPPPGTRHGRRNQMVVIYGLGAAAFLIFYLLRRFSRPAPGATNDYLKD